MVKIRNFTSVLCFFMNVYGGKLVMLSNKMTFSLTSLVVLIAFGLVCVVPSVFADKDPKKTYWDLDVTISEAESMVDVSEKDGMQIASGRHRNSRNLDLDGDGLTYIPGSGTTDGTTANLDLDTNGDDDNDADSGDVITLSVKFSHSVNLEQPGASLQDIEEAKGGRGDDDPKKPSPADSGGNFGVDDIYVAAFDVKERQLGVLPLVKTGTEIVADFIDATAPGKNFLVSIHQSHLLNAYGNAFEISKLVFFIPKGISGAKDKALADDDADASVTRGIRKADLGHVIAHFGPGAHQHLNNASKPDGGFVVELVDEDQGNPSYYKGTDTTPITLADVDDADGGNDAYNAAGSGTPGVVTIDQLRERSGFIETEPFDIRIILTEEPMGGLKPAMILVEGGGAATKVTKGTPLNGALPAVAEDTVRNAVDPGAGTPPAYPGLPAIKIPAQEVRDNELTNEMATYYVLDNATAASATGIAMVGATGTPTEYSLPEATGPDNMYHQYFVTITPNPKVDGSLMISVAQFSDNVKPVGKRYVPLTSQQKIATKLTGAAKHVRDMRVANETLTVQVKTGADTTSDTAVLQAAYEARRKDKGGTAGTFDNAANVKEITPKLVIPAEGYLVLAKGKKDASHGIADSPAILDKKPLATQKKYNIAYEYSLPAPADNLSDFFRNGGTLTLAYSDIPQATTAKNADGTLATAVTGKEVKGGDEDTGYYGATTNAYTKGSVVISEIMWGLDIDAKTSQYIELHNPGTTDIGIDKLEWVIAVGEAPSGFTVIDTVSNVKDPVTGKYWSPPGANGVTKADTANPTTKSLVSMSRISGTAGADGTAAASWAPSILPSVNLSGLRVGTPGAANNADTSAQDAAAKAAADKAKADAAAAVKTPANVATASDLRITELMVASNEGRLPQWIEITNVSAGAVSLKGWVVGIDNDSTDADVVASSLSIKLDDVTLDAGQSALVVSKTGRNSGVSARAPKDNNAGDLDSARIVDAHSQIKPASKVYSMLSEMSFRISLEPPLPLAGGVSDRGDVVGNLGGGWELEMSEGNRSSLIRREMGKTAEIMGTDAAGWVLASETSLIGAYVSTYYGDKDDVGTPGYNAGGALPVELSKFGAKRDPLTGQVVITWETQSELNNAGFFIKRAEHKTAQFVPVNPTMIPGAGTTSEKQSYTYTDTTAKPNIVYYYQIEDVSLDGNRQTLTRAHRLKGHVGAAGKLTTMWGELKERE